MAGRPAPEGDILLAPSGVVRRRSTDVLAIEDPHVAAAVAFIRKHAGQPFGVETVMRQVSVSRRWLEQKFKQLVGCTIYQYVCRIRIEHAKDLLTARHKMLLQDIARACGFSSAKRFRLVFERLTGQRPAQYRRARQNRHT
jgi:LacI family transcriptional regulator